MSEINARRVGLWTVLWFLVLARHLAIEPLPVAGGPRYSMLVRGDGDPRAFSDVPTSVPGRDAVIAWVGGSPLNVNAVRPTPPLPALAMDRLGLVRGREGHAAVYLVSGSPVFDEYLCVLHALRRGADAVVVALNPYALLGGFPLSYRSGFYGRSVVNAARFPQAWPWLALFVSPAEAVAALVAPVAPVLHERLTLYRRVEARLHARLPVAVAPSSKARDLFLHSFRRKSDPPPRATLTAVQDWLLEECADDVAPGRQAVVDSMLATLVASRVPTLIYLDPLDEGALARPHLRAKARAVERWAEDLAGRWKGRPGLLVVPRLPPEALRGVRFLDRIHLAEAGELPGHFAGRLRGLLEQRR